MIATKTVEGYGRTKAAHRTFVRLWNFKRFRACTGLSKIKLKRKQALIQGVVCRGNTPEIFIRY